MRMYHHGVLKRQRNMGYQGEMWHVCERYENRAKNGLGNLCSILLSYRDRNLPLRRRGPRGAWAATSIDEDAAFRQSL